MKALGYSLLVLAGGVAGYLIREYGVKATYGSPAKTGLGAAGTPSYGRPKTSAERLATHTARYGEGKLPPRGTGLSNF